MGKENAQSTFELNLEDNSSGPAESAASAMQRLRDSIDADTKALKELQAAMKRLHGGTSVNIQQHKDLKAKIDATKDSISKAQGALLDLGGTMGKSQKPARGFGAVLERLQAQAQGVGGPLGRLSGRFGSIKGLLAGGAIALGVVAIVASLALLVAGTIAATIALGKYGIEQANAGRSELLRLEGMTKLRSIYGLVAGNAKEIQQSIDRVSGSVALGRGEVAKYAESLYKAGLRGANLSDALEAVAIKAATQGDAAAQQWAGLASAIALSGGSVKRMSDQVKARLGGIAMAQMLDLNVQAEKMRENFGMLFSDLKIEGFLKGLKSITDQFSQSTVAGRALKTLAESVLNPMLAVLEFLMPLGKRFFQGMILGAQFLTIQILKLAIWVKKTFGGDMLKDIDLANVALHAGIFVVMSLAAGFGILATAVGLLLLPFAAFAGIVYTSYRIGKAFWGMVGDGYDLVMAVDWASLGTSICDGIVNGINSGKAWVVDAIQNLGSSAWTGFKDALGIHSPSKEFAKLGVQLPAGVEQGIESGSGSLDRTVSEMVQPANTPTAPSGGGARGGQGASVHIDQIVVNAKDDDTAKTIARGLRQEIEEVFSGMLVQMGGAPA